MSTTNPLTWAESKRSKSKKYAEGYYAAIARKAIVVCTPGVPVAAHIGFADNGSTDECTTGWISCSDSERARALAKTPPRKPLGGDPRTGYGKVSSHNLHECGPGGVESNTVPHEVATGDCAWVKGARSDTVRAILGRAGVEGAKWYGAHDDQAAIGIWNLARHSRAVAAKLLPALAWDDDAPWSLWRWMCTMSGWSAGDGGFAAHVKRYETTLASVPESRRWGAFLRAASTYEGRGSKHKRPSYTALRSEQKRRAGMLACEFTGESVAWFGDDDSGAYDALVKSAAG